MLRCFKTKKTSATLLKEYLAMAQSDVDTAISKLTDATALLSASVAQLTALNIPVPTDTSKLGPAVDALVTAAQGVQTAVNAEATKINPSAG